MYYNLTDAQYLEHNHTRHHRTTAMFTPTQPRIHIIYYNLLHVLANIPRLFHYYSDTTSYAAKYSLPKLYLWTKLKPALHHDTNLHIATSTATHSILLINLTIYTNRRHSIIAILTPTQTHFQANTTDTRSLSNSQYYTHIL